MRTYTDISVLFWSSVQKNSLSQEERRVDKGDSREQRAAGLVGVGGVGTGECSREKWRQSCQATSAFPERAVKR